MERKHFITSIVAGSAAVAAAGMALGATPSPNASPGPFGNSFPGGCGPYRPRGAGSGMPEPTTSPNPQALMEHADRNLAKLIALLQRDPNDYAGHKEQAIGYLQQALAQVQASLGSGSGMSDNPFQSQP
jgi:hypothetical protein